MGGMHGFGPIVRDDAPFHAPWEVRVRAMATALIRQGVYNLDEFRRAIESIPPAQYLSLTYFERWLEAVRMLLVEKAQMTPAEIDSLLQQFEPEPDVQRRQRRDNPALASAIAEGLRNPTDPPHAAAAPRFRPGDRVMAKNLHVREHTRLPRYIRGKRGVVQQVYGSYDFPDTNAHGRGKHPQPVYSVRFAARELWGDAAGPQDSVSIDLWESYLDPA
jgi:nitrile hydratase